MKPATEQAAEGADGDKAPRKWGQAKFKAIPAAVKRKRVNYRLRKLIAPKAPLQVLNEMVGAVSYSFVDNPQGGFPPGMAEHMQFHSLYTAQCVVEGEYFTGTGPSKAIAKNICAEHAIQFVVSRRATDPAKLDQTNAETGKPLQPNQFVDETPWVQIASLALFKLFNDWQAQGYVIPQELLKTPDYYNNQGMLPKDQEDDETMEVRLCLHSSIPSPLLFYWKLFVLICILARPSSDKEAGP